MGGMGRWEYRSMRLKSRRIWTGSNRSGATFRDDESGGESRDDWLRENLRPRTSKTLVYEHIMPKPFGRLQGPGLIRRHN